MSLPATPAAWQALITAEVADVNGVVAANVAAWWAITGTQTATPYTQYLLTKRLALVAIRAQVRAMVSKSVGPLRIQYSDMATHVKDDLAELDLLIREVRAGGRVGFQPVTTATPETPQLTPPANETLPDLNDPRYRGDPGVLYAPFAPTRGSGG